MNSPETKSLNHEAELQERTREKLEKLRELPAIKEAFEFLSKELPVKYPELAKKFPEALPYHGEPHSEDVMHEAVMFALEDGSLTEREIELLAVAASYHDAGFAEVYDSNEEEGAKLAKAAMGRLGYSEEEADRVFKIIMGTRVKLMPNFEQLVDEKTDKNDKLAQLLADADVSNFGREDYFEKSEKVFQELVGMGKAQDTPEARAGFKKFGVNMLKTHKWNTAAASRLRDEQKSKNLAELEKSIS